LKIETGARFFQLDCDLIIIENGSAGVLTGVDPEVDPREDGSSHRTQLEVIIQEYDQLKEPEIMLKFCITIVNLEL